MHDLGPAKSLSGSSQSASSYVRNLTNQKGGTSKTTLALCLAVAATRAGHATAVVDFDPKAAAASWKVRREETIRLSSRARPAS